MTPTTAVLTPGQRTEIFQVLNNQRMNLRNGSIRLNRLSRAARTFLQAAGFVRKDDKGTYRPAAAARLDGKAFCLRMGDIMRLGPTFFWHVVEPMIQPKGSTQAIAADTRWEMLHIYPKGHSQWRERDEAVMREVLIMLAARGYISFVTDRETWKILKLERKAAA